MEFLSLVEPSWSSFFAVLTPTAKFSKNLFPDHIMIQAGRIIKSSRSTLLACAPRRDKPCHQSRVFQKPGIQNVAPSAKVIIIDRLHDARRSVVSFGITFLPMPCVQWITAACSAIL
jgi:hypothetical protein